MKKYLLGVFAIVLGLGLSAFNLRDKNKGPLTGEKWFVFNGADPADLNDASKYSLDGNGSSATVCPSTTLMYRCEIKAVPQTGDPSVPDLSTIISERKRSTP